MSACEYPLSYEYSKYMVYSSFLIGASSFVCLYYNDYITFLLMFMLCLTSVNYWYKPEYGPRRDMDMYLCKILNLYFYANTLGFYSEFANEVFVNGFYTVMLYYLLEHLCYHFKNEQWIVFHMAIHFHVAFFTPFVLYIL